MIELLKYLFGQTVVIDQIGEVEVVGVAADSKWESFADTSRQGPMSADPGVMVYGRTRKQALAAVEALALRVIADRLEHGEAVPGGVTVSFAA